MDEHLHKDPLEEFFRRSLDDFGDEPSDDVWNGLDNRLALHESGAGGEGVSPSATPSTGGILTASSFLKWMGMAAIVGLLSLVTYYIYQQNNEIVNLSQHIDQQTQTIEELHTKVDNLQTNEEEKLQKGEHFPSANSLQNNNLEPKENGEKANTTVSKNELNSEDISPKVSSKNPLHKKSIQKKKNDKQDNIGKTKSSISLDNSLQKELNQSFFNSLQNSNLEENKVENAGGNDIAAKKEVNQSVFNPLQNNNLQQNKVKTIGEKDIAAKKEIEMTSMNPLQNKDLEQNKVENIEGNDIVVKKEIEMTSMNPLQNKDLEQNKVETIEENDILAKKEVNQAAFNSLQNKGLQQDKAEGVDFSATIMEDDASTKMDKIDETETATDEQSTEVKKSLDKLQKKKTPKVKPDKKKTSKSENALAQKSSKSTDNSVEEMDNQSLPQTPSASDSQWTIAATFAPTRSFRTIKSTIPNDNMLKKINEQEKPQLSFETGIEVAYQFKTNWYLKSGINYRQVNQMATYKPKLEYRPNAPREVHNGKPRFIYKYDVQGSYGLNEVEFGLEDFNNITDGESFDLEVKNDRIFNWVRVPLLVQHDLGKGRLQANIMGGLAANFLLKEKQNFNMMNSMDNRFRHRDTRSKKPLPQEKITNSYFEYVLGVGLSYQMNERLQLFVNPTYSAALAPVYKNKVLKTYPFSLSGTVGVRLSL